MSQSTTRSRIASRHAAQRRRGQLQLLIGVMLLAVFISVVLIIISQPRQPSTTVSVDYLGIEQSEVSVGQGTGYAIGSSDAPVTLIEFSDFSCPHCAAIESAIHRLITDYTASGELHIIYMPMAFLSDQSVTAAKAAVCASEQGQFWQFQSQLWQVYGRNGSGGYTNINMSTIADTLGLDAAEFSQCRQSSRVDAVLGSVSAEFDARGLRGTPSLFLNGQSVTLRSEETAYEDLKAQIESLLSSQP